MQQHKSNMRKTIIHGLWLMLFLLILPSTILATNHKNITIAMVVKSIDNPTYELTKIAAEIEANHLGIKLMWVGPVELDTEIQIEIIKQLIKKNVDAIAIDVSDPTALNPVITDAVSKGIIVTTWDSDTIGSDRLFYIGTDSYTRGVRCAKEMMRLIGPNKKVFILSPPASIPNTGKQIKGFINTIKKASIKITDILYYNENIENNIRIIENYFYNNQSIHGLFLVNGWPNWYNPNKFPNFKKFKGKIVYFDYCTFTKSLISQKKIASCIDHDFANIGTLTIRYLTDVIRNKTKYPKKIDPGLCTINKNNINN